MAANMSSVATIAAARVLEAHGLFTCLHKFIPLDEIFASGLDPEHFAVTIGLSDDDLGKLGSYGGRFRYLCIDVANGYTEKFSAFIAKARTLLPDTVIIAGNVCTPEMTEELLLRGADVVKVGIGPGNHCTTRRQAGVGYPQLSAIIECADAAHGLGGHIVGDGGCAVPGDVAKGFGGGADFMMLGSMLAAHDENSEFDAEGKALVYGMSSSHAMAKFYGGINEYRASEGRISQVSGRGPLADTIGEILGSIRSTCTYIGAREIRHMGKCTTFLLVGNQYSKEYESRTIGY